MGSSCSLDVSCCSLQPDEQVPPSSEKHATEAKHSIHAEITCPDVMHQKALRSVDNASLVSVPKKLVQQRSLTSGSVPTTNNSASNFLTEINSDENFGQVGEEGVASDDSVLPSTFHIANANATRQAPAHRNVTMPTNHAEKVLRRTSRPVVDANPDDDVLARDAEATTSVPTSPNPLNRNTGRSQHQRNKHLTALKKQQKKLTGRGALFSSVAVRGSINPSQLYPSDDDGDGGVCYDRHRSASPFSPPPVDRNEGNSLLPLPAAAILPTHPPITGMPGAKLSDATHSAVSHDAHLAPPTGTTMSLSPGMYSVDDHGRARPHPTDDPAAFQAVSSSMFLSGRLSLTTGSTAAFDTTPLTTAPLSPMTDLISSSYVAAGVPHAIQRSGVTHGSPGGVVYNNSHAFGPVGLIGATSAPSAQSFSASMSNLFAQRLSFESQSTRTTDSSRPSETSAMPPSIASTQQGGVEVGSSEYDASSRTRCPPGRLQAAHVTQQQLSALGRGSAGGVGSEDEDVFESASIPAPIPSFVRSQ
jgi:hypothetical protein